MNTVEFGSLFEFIRNGMNVKQDKSGHGLPVTRIETISDSTIDPSRVGFAGLEESDCSDWLLQRGDILFSHINSVEHIGKCAVYTGRPEKLVHGMNLLCLRSDPKQILPEFAKYLIRSKQFRGRLANFINKAVNQASVSITNLKKISVVIPSLAEQLRVANFLDKAEVLRTKRRAAIATLHTLPQAIFLEMIGDPIKNPKGWPPASLGDVVDLLTGYPFRSEEYVGEFDSVRLCRGANILPGRIDWSDVVHWSKSKSAEFSQFALIPGDVLIAMDRPWISEGFKIAQVQSADCPSLLVQRVSRLRGRSGVLSEFLYHLLRQAAFTHHCRPTETTVPHISPRDIHSYTFPLPPMTVQQDFAKRVGMAAKLNSCLTTSSAQIDELFAALQVRAFRGEL